MSCQCGCCGSTATPGCTYTIGGRTALELACSGTFSDNIDDLRGRWSIIDCVGVYNDVLYEGENGIREYNSKNLARVQADIYNVFDLYTSWGFDFSPNVNANTNNFQYSLLNLCASPLVPGGCDLFLTGYCSQFSREQIGGNSVLNSLCGCYSPPLYPGIPQECDPLCHITSTSQKADPCTGTISRCSNTVCVLDNVNVNLVDTSTSTAFQQLCAGCQTGSSPCVCIIGGITPEDTLQKAGISTSYTQYCGSNSICFRKTGSDQLEQVECPPVSSVQSSKKPYEFPFAVLVVFIIIVVLVIAALIAIRGQGVEIERVPSPSDTSASNVVPSRGRGVYSGV